jgi:hypothetical protein
MTEEVGNQESLFDVDPRTTIMAVQVLCLHVVLKSNIAEKHLFQRLRIAHICMSLKAGYP